MLRGEEVISKREKEVRATSPNGMGLGDLQGLEMLACMHGVRLMCIYWGRKTRTRER